MIIRDAQASDAPALAAIYGHHALHGLGTFEEVCPSNEDMAERLEAIRALGLPYLVAEDGGAVTGFAYAGPFRTRSAYRFTAEDSVYIAPGHLGRGLGRTLLQAVLDRSEALGVRQMVACIGDSGNLASIGLHQALGFEPAGVIPALGWKHGRWVDIVFMRRALGAGADTPPVER